MTIRLHTLGQSCIEVGTSRIGPEAERLFALLLYLAVERGKDVSRVELRRLLWPDADTTHATHSLRQLIYRVKRMGVGIETLGARIALPINQIEDDFGPFLPSATHAGVLNRLTSPVGPFLPGYVPSFSDEYSGWVELQRDRIHSSLRRELVRNIVERKSRGEWHAAESLATDCLQLDPLNEEATFALAEAAAVSGSKTRAIRILDRFLQEIGLGPKDIRLPAISLRKRITEATALCDIGIPSQPPFVGRVRELQTLNSSLELASRGQGSAYRLVGEPGIGKSRLLTEFSRSAMLKGSRVVRVQLRAHDGRRPLSAFAEMTPKLLELPGALGSSPESLRRLHSLTAYNPESIEQPHRESDAEHNYSCLRQAVLDLVASICGENCLVLLLEDIEHIDPASTEMLRELVETSSYQQLLIVMTSRHLNSDTDDTRAALATVHQLVVGPLDQKESFTLLHHYADLSPTYSPSFWSWCAKKGGGNPYYLSELARHGHDASGSYQLPEVLSGLVANRLETLRPLTRKLMHAIAILGRHSTLDRLDRLLGCSTIDLLDSLDEAERAGLIDIDATQVHAKTDLLAEVALQSQSNASRRLLHRRAALLLQDEGATAQPSGLIWDCAEHWQCSGDDSRAVGALRACARYCMHIGMPSEASKILKNVANKSGQGNASLLILDDWMSALQVEEDWTQVRDVAKRIAAINASIVPPPSRHTSHELTVVEAEWHSGAEPQALLNQVLNCVRSAEAEPPHVLRAAVQGLILACDSFQRDVAESLYQTILRIDRDNPNLPLSHYAEYVYNLSFGDLELVTSSAHRWIARSRLCGNPATLSRCLRNAAVGLHHSGLTSAAVEACTEGYQIALSRYLPNAATGAAIRLGGIYCDIGDYDVAASWLAAANEGVRAPASKIFFWDYCCRMAEVCLRQGTYQDVLPWLKRAHSSQVIRSTYSRIESTALWSEYRVLVQHAVPTDEEMATLLTLFDTVKCRPTCDMLVVAICRAMAVRDQQPCAVEFASLYESQWRRERYPVSAQLRQFLTAEPVSLAIDRNSMSTLEVN